MNAVEQGSRFVVRLCSCIGSGDNVKVTSKLSSLLKELRGSSGGGVLQTQSPTLYERILLLTQSLQKAVELAETAGGVAAMQVISAATAAKVTNVWPLKSELIIHAATEIHSIRLAPDPPSCLTGRNERVLQAARDSRLRRRR